MALDSWQKISRVLPGQPFGNGSDGVLTVSGSTTQSPTDESCSGSIGTKTLNTAGTSLTNGTVVLIHQSKGSGVGVWEINRVASGGGTSTLTLQENLAYGYADGGSNQSQAIKIPMYSSVTIQAGKTLSGKIWDGNVGGVLLFASNGITTVPGILLGTGRGYGTSPGPLPGDADGYSGEGHTGNGTQTTNANGSGGGGSGPPEGGGAGGGGHATSGGSGNNGTSGDKSGTGGGVTPSTANLSRATFGGQGGGGRGKQSDASGGKGGIGGGLTFLFVKNLSLTGGMPTYGAIGANTDSVDKGGESGGGAGGGVMLQCQVASIGTNKIAANGGPNGPHTRMPNGFGNGGFGGVGRIAIHHSGTVTGTTTPTYNDTVDGTLVESSGAFIFNLL